VKADRLSPEVLPLSMWECGREVASIIECSFEQCLVLRYCEKTRQVLDNVDSQIGDIAYIYLLVFLRASRRYRVEPDGRTLRTEANSMHRLLYLFSAPVQ